MDTQSNHSRATSYSTTAHALLDQIKQQTTPEINKEFHKVLSSFKRKEIDSSQVYERVKQVLKDYPQLLQQFENHLPGQNATFSSALLFVNRGILC